MDQCANNTANGKFTFSFSQGRSVSGRFASQAEHAANLVSRHDLSRRSKREDFHSVGKKQSRVFTVTDKTSITKAGKPATMTDVTENEESSGAYWKNADGTLEAKTVKLGSIGKAKASAASPTTSPKGSPEPKP